MLLSMLRSEFCLGFLGKCTLLAQHSDGVCESIFIHPFLIAFESLANFSQVWQGLQVSKHEVPTSFLKTDSWEKKKTGSITAFIEEKAEAWGQFLTDIKESMWRNDVMNELRAKKAPGGTFTLLNSRKCKKESWTSFSTAQNYFLEALIQLF